MRITVGHTPDSDDAFMFYGMLAGGVRSPGFEVEHVVEDIEALNRRAATPQLDVTAVSVHACAHIPGYTILRSGGSFGLGYGPLLVTRNEDGGTAPGELADAKRTIAVPGRMTSAFLLLQTAIGRFDYLEMNFAQIPEAVRSGKVDAGLVIHEAQLSYASEGLASVLDLGRWWSEKTGGLPVPLGVNVMRTDLGDETISRFDAYLRDSILYGLENSSDAIEYAMQYSRGKPPEMIRRFVRMYVNESTVNMKEAGEKAINTMFEMASERDLLAGRDGGPFRPRIAPKL